MVRRTAQMPQMSCTTAPTVPATWTSLLAPMVAAFWCPSSEFFPSSRVSRKQCIKSNASQNLNLKSILCIWISSSAVTVWMTVETAVMRSAACTAPAPVKSSPARMECVFHQRMYAMVIQTVKTALMNSRACAGVQNPPVHLENSCAILGSALTSTRSATIKGTALTTVMRRAVVRHHSYLGKGSLYGCAQKIQYLARQE